MNLHERLMYKDKNELLISKTELYGNLVNEDNIYIFGAKGAAIYSHKYLAGRFDIKGFIVSERRDNPLSLCGKRVMTFSDIKERGICLQKIALILPKYTEEMCDYLKGVGFEKVLSSPVDITYVMSEVDEAYCKNIFPSMHIMVPSKNRCVDSGVIDREVFIYAVTVVNKNHEEIKRWNEKYIHYIQAGAALSTERIAELVDDVGENVSLENLNLNEHTVSYWIAHNDNIHSYVGMFHYSRGLVVNYEILSDMISENYDILLGLPMLTKQPMIYRTEGIVHDAIMRVSPEFIVASEEYFLNRIFFKSNLMIAKNYVYKEYVDWTFKIIGELKNLMQEYQIETYPRQLAYYAEHLTNIYIYKNRFRFKIGFVEQEKYYDGI